MQIDKTTLDRLLSLDDASLVKTINLLCAAVGIPDESRDNAINNLRLVRATLGNATDADIKKAMNMLGEEKAAALMNMLGGEKK